MSVFDLIDFAKDWEALDKRQKRCNLYLHFKAFRMWFFEMLKCVYNSKLDLWDSMQKSFRSTLNEKRIFSWFLKTQVSRMAFWLHRLFFFAQNYPRIFGNVFHIQPKLSLYQFTMDFFSISFSYKKLNLLFYLYILCFL